MDDYATRMAFSKYDSSVYLAMRTTDNDGYYSGGYVKVSAEGIYQ